MPTAPYSVWLSVDILLYLDSLRNRSLVAHWIYFLSMPLCLYCILLSAPSMGFETIVQSLLVKGLLSLGGQRCLKTFHGL